MHCQPGGNQALDAMHFFSDSYEEKSIGQDDKIQIGLYSDINLIRHQHRGNFIFLKNTIWEMRKEFHPISSKE